MGENLRSSYPSPYKNPLTLRLKQNGLGPLRGRAVATSRRLSNVPSQSRGVQAQERLRPRYKLMVFINTIYGLGAG